MLDDAACIECCSRCFYIIGPCDWFWCFKSYSGMLEIFMSMSPKAFLLRYSRVPVRLKDANSSERRRFDWVIVSLLIWLVVPPLQSRFEHYPKHVMRIWALAKWSKPYHFDLVLFPKLFRRVAFLLLVPLSFHGFSLQSSFGFVDYHDRRSAALAIMTLHGRQL